MSWEDRELKRNYKDEPVPQHWGGNDWEVTGVDHPLPVANYTQNDNGLWIPVSKDNPMPTQVTGSILEEMHSGELVIPAETRLTVVPDGTSISNRVEKINFLANASHSEWGINIRFSISDESAASIFRRLDLRYDSSSLKNVFPEPDSIYDRSYFLYGLPRTGSVYMMYIENLSEERDLEISYRLEGVLK